MRGILFLNFASSEPLREGIKLFSVLFAVHCRPSEFQCKSGYGCLDTSFVCDRHSLCLDGSDEICGNQNYGVFKKNHFISLF